MDKRLRFGLLEINWEYVGALLANQSSEEQVAFFKAFIKECKTWGTHFQIEQQLSFINKHLSLEEREILEMLSYKGE